MLLAGKKPFKITQERIEKLTNIGFQWAGDKTEKGGGGSGIGIGNGTKGVVGVAIAVEKETSGSSSSSGHSSSEEGTSTKPNVTTSNGTLLQI